MISGLDLTSTIDYNLKDDVKNPTVWKLGVISHRVFSKIFNGNNGIEGNLRVVQLGLRGWENFNGIEFVTAKENIYGEDFEVIPLNLIDRIPLKAITELSEKVIEVSQLAEIERKN